MLCDTQTEDRFHRLHSWAIGQSGRSQLFSLRNFFLQKSISFTTDSTGRKLKWLLTKVSVFATYDLYLFYVNEWLNNENIPS